MGRHALHGQFVSQSMTKAGLTKYFTLVPFLYPSLNNLHPPTRDYWQTSCEENNALPIGRTEAADVFCWAVSSALTHICTATGLGCR
jgi:hypothetical protein|mmetsp:Transcript_53921/g.89803  ORF Transcript_53921/g.89803 Transcript_53921/m.89803 type:complete len:87 (+) Transcript_53921:1680-1940(+)